MKPNLDANLLFTGELRTFILRHVLKCRDLTECIPGLPELTHIDKDEFSCTCPWCGEEGFRLNKKSGDCSCSACGDTGDLIDLIQQYENVSMNYVAGMFTAILEYGGVLC